MSHYHFHVYEGREVIDEEGTDLADIHAAHAESMRFAGELLIHEGERIIANGGCLVLVKDDHDVTQFRLDVTVALQPTPISPGRLPMGL